MPEKARSSSSAAKTVAQAILAGACIALGGGLYAHFMGPGTTLVAPATQIDHSSAKERAEREQKFLALSPLPLQLVPTQQLSAAIDGMLLSAPDRQALLASARPTVQPTTSQSQLMPADSAAAQSSLSSQPDAPGQTPAAQPAYPGANPLRLAWITLWDTDVQDGDVVRLESQGYSRTVTLTKHGETFAIPVPASGIVRIIGMKDGDGGGITVGLASGAATAVFPIMSPGQTLELRVVLD